MVTTPPTPASPTARRPARPGRRRACISPDGFLARPSTRTRTLFLPVTSASTLAKDAAPPSAAGRLALAVDDERDRRALAAIDQEGVVPVGVDRHLVVDEALEAVVLDVAAGERAVEGRDLDHLAAAGLAGEMFLDVLDHAVAVVVELLGHCRPALSPRRRDRSSWSRRGAARAGRCAGRSCASRRWRRCPRWSRPRGRRT